MGLPLYLRSRWAWAVLFFSLFCGLFYFFGQSRLAVSDEQKAIKIQRLYRGYQFFSFRHIDDLTAREVFELKKQKHLVFVDVRQAKERAVSMIEGAISKEDFEGSLKKYQGKAIVVYCTIGSRSGELVRQWADRGVETYNLKGGVLAWAHAGGELFRDGARTNQVHVYGEGWDLLPKKYEAVW